ncbi:Type II secretion system protein F [Posidoniimonas polymericola]|uniref:Type II secretion system protein F n=1 Tax=Posidoniimonas polymericola TaxID=2528002 RepID=A0A5C5YMJ9_9BACT|nr:type II secretion system F family protein [Posidoniimonas polymericola]TWT76142.1 Type II secretion system protein F [Posidoniimonas polymericola]
MSVAAPTDLAANASAGDARAAAFGPPARAGAAPPPGADAGPKPPEAAAAAPPRAVGGAITKREQVMFITQLAIMTRSGVDVADALRSISARAKRPALRAAMEELHELLQEGKCLSQALAAQAGRFDGVVIASVTAGEASGTLPEVLGRLGGLMRDELRTKAALRSVLSYPIVLTVVTFGVLTGMVFFVLPQFAGIYESSRAPTPVVTKLLLNGSSLLRAYWWLVALAAAGTCVAFWQVGRSTSGRRFFDNLCYSLPLLSSVCRSLSIGRAFRLQGVLLDSGVPLLEVLELTQQASRSTLMRELNHDMQQAVLVGKNMSSAMINSRCVPDGALEMVATAESNGQLAPVLQTVGEFFEGEGEQQLKELVKLAEPIIIVLLGIVVGGIVLAVMLPMLDLSSAGGR